MLYPTESHICCIKDLYIHVVYFLVLLNKGKKKSPIRDADFELYVIMAVAFVYILTVSRLLNEMKIRQTQINLDIWDIF